MKIARVSVYQVDIALTGNGYSVSGGRIARSLDNTVVFIETDAGISGVGESVPMGNAYLPAFAGGVRAGLDVVAPSLVGMDPREALAINHAMDTALLGHPYVKTGLDMACWDIAGKAAQVPLYTLLGGKLNDSPRICIALSSASNKEMTKALEAYQEQGYVHFSAKVGNNPDEDIDGLRSMCSALQAQQTIVADANREWTAHDAIRVCQALAGVGKIYIEEPCRSYEECLMVRRSAPQPIILDECIDTIGAFLRGWEDKAMDCVNIKISRLGGITKTRQLRDLSATLGIALYIQCAWATSITAAAIAHLAHSTPERLFLGVWTPDGWNATDIASGAPEVRNGAYIASDRPGLGVKPDIAALGDPIAVYD